MKYLTLPILVAIVLGVSQTAHAQLQLQATQASIATTSAIPVHTPEWTNPTDSDPGVKTIDIDIDEVLTSDDPGEADIDSIKEDTDTTKESKEKAGTEDINIGVGELQETQHNQTDLEFQTERSSESGSQIVPSQTPVIVAPAVDQTETKESKEKAGTEDINIGMGELQEMNKADLIEGLANDTASAAGIYLKFDDIKGEVDLKAETKTETGSVQFGDGQHGRLPTKKLKEIVVVGREVRGWDPVKKEKINGVALTDPEMVNSAADLALMLAATTEADTRLEEVTFNYEKISVNYNTEIKILGFIKVAVPATYEVVVATDSEEFGRIKVKMPWWHVFGRKTIRPHDFVVGLAKDNGTDEHTLAARIFSSISSTLATKHHN